MRFILYISFLLFIRSALYAQEYPFALADTSKNGIALTSNYTINTNSLSNKFLTSIYKNAFIDDTKKDDLFSRLKPSNKICFTSQMGLSAYKSLSKYDLTVYTSFEEHAILKSILPLNMFKLILTGNNIYAGKVLPINNIVIQGMHYEQLRLGVIKNLNSTTTKYQLGGALSLISGNRFIDLDFESINLYTQPDANYIDLNALGYYNRSDSLHHYIQPSGKGISVDLLFSAENKKNKWEIILSDIGNIWWNKNSLHYTYNNNYRFEGLPIYNPMIMNSDIKNDVDSIKKEIFNSTINNYQMAMPTSLYASFTRTIIPNKLSITGVSSQNFWIYYSSDWQLIPTYKYKCIAISLQAGYHSISKLHYGLSTIITFPYKWQLVFNASYINAYLSHENTYASGLQLTIKKTL